MVAISRGTAQCRNTTMIAPGTMMVKTGMLVNNLVLLYSPIESVQDYGLN